MKRTRASKEEEEQTSSQQSSDTEVFAATQVTRAEEETEGPLEEGYKNWVLDSYCKELAPHFRALELAMEEYVEAKKRIATPPEWLRELLTQLENKHIMSRIDG